MQDQKPYQIKIPDKFYFKIGEVSKIAELPSHVLRFWETEFKRIKPRRTESGQRSYTKKDIEIILEIKHLLYEKKFTIDGARKFINAKAEAESPATRRFLEDLRTELSSIRKMLDNN
ncbi:MAG: MerR family transcriptional regulator [Desulfobacteraceae bacterium]|jgi:DNA-binding transcriptional MerR regulator|nr:MerR family transcriptional regulator [Desulfobacteraceae bacterium]